MDPETKKYLDRIYNRLASIEQRMVKQDEKASWLTANQLNKKLGINAKALARMRTIGQVEYKNSRGGGYLYKLESIADEFKKQTA